MNLNYLNQYFSEKGLDSQKIDLYYDFDEVSGVFLKNKIYDNKVQFYPVTSGFFINKKLSPGFFNTKYGEVNFKGSGVFQGTNTFQIFQDYSLQENTMFFNFANLNCNKTFTLNSNSYTIPTGNTQVLAYIKSKENINPFEIILGINDANKLTLEFFSNQENFQVVNTGSLSFQNVCVLKFKNSLLEAAYHDIIENEIITSRISLTGDYFNQNKNCYLGGIPSGLTKNLYTGFFGVIDDTLFINNYLDDETNFNISKIFLKTGELTNTTLLTGLQINLINNAYINPTGIIGTGITGYQNTKIEDALISGNLTGVYEESALTGTITGEKIEIDLVPNPVIISTGQITTKYNLYDEIYAGNFTKNYIIFNKKLDIKDVYEIQYYLDSDMTIRYPVYSNASDIYVINNNDLNKNISIYFNGLRLVSGDNYVYIEDNKFTIRDYITGYKESKDLVFYTVSSLTGATTYKTYYTQTGKNLGEYYSAYTFTNPAADWQKLNIFLNGQKLTSGINYIIGGSNFNELYVDKDLPTGLISMIKDNFIIRETGSNVKNISRSLSYNNEQIWVNGVYQQKNYNYIATSCFNNILHSNQDIDIKENLLFNNEDHRFNL